ncbi:hypothetical protein QFC20_004697 [Naganishia adeliensis]|uniref:Uncharacterized protein n=1 Tax=Naganishia adeliensis TaxID=92952 RepID=A0ACC2VXJ1_9TREE|nr:hypothetical protein QFC20_004697 [Naganishia adeliensis]
MSRTSSASQKWSNFGSSMSGPAMSYRSVTASPSHFISISHNKLNNLSLDLLYPTPSVPAAPKDSSELLRRTLLISNAMMAAKKQVKTERYSAYDEARYNKRNTSSRGHLRGTARSASSSIHALPSSQQLDTLAEAAGSDGQIFAPSQANSIEAKEGEEWFEETWSETLHEGERDSAMFGSSGSTSITVRSEYQEFSSTQGSEVVYHAKSNANKPHIEVQVLPVESDEDSSSADSSRSTSPVSSESEAEPVQQIEPELVAVYYTRPVVLPSQILGIQSAVSDDSDVPDLWLDELPEYEHVFDASPAFVRSESSLGPLKPRLLPTIIRDKFYEPSRFETGIEEDPALLALSALPPTPALETVAPFEDVHVEPVYSDDEDSDELRTPDETACDEFGYAVGDNSFGGTSPSSFDESIEQYFASGYRSDSKDVMGNSDADWEQMGADIPLFP